MADPAIQSINQHTQKTSLDWLLNILVQPSTGTGSGVAPAAHEQYGLSLDLLRQALVEVGNVVNNITTEIPGKVLDARQGNALRVLISSVADGVRWQEEILSLVSTPPAYPTDGDRHIVGQSATGAWLGNDGEIATWDATGATWTFETPEERWGVFNHATTELLYYHVGAWMVLGDLGQITTILHEAEAARDQILNDPGFQIVVADLLGDDEIGTVAAGLAVITAVNNNSANINAVAGNSTNINAVAGNETNINAVNANKLNIDAVANDIVAVQDASDNMLAIIDAPTQASLASQARDKAEKWADEAEDTEVEPSQYSAKHHALKAAASAASAHLADAAANKQITIDGKLYQYALVYEKGHLIRRFTEVI
jgi:hypothetical protein